MKKVLEKLIMIVMIFLIAFGNTRRFEAASIDLSTSKYFPPIQNQGESGSCVSFAIGYYQYTYEVCKKLNIDAKNGGNDKWFSPAQLYCYFNNGSGETGILFESAYQMISEQGLVKWSVLPYKENYMKTLTINKDALYDAFNYRADSGFGKLKNAGTDISGLKAKLNEGKVCVISVWSGVDKDNKAAWQITKSTNRTGEYVIYSANKGSCGHALAVVGYDDDIVFNVNGSTLKGAFKVADSYGTSASNHKNGYIWIAYDAFKDKSSVATLNNNSKRVGISSRAGNKYWYITDVKTNEKPYVFAEICANGITNIGSFTPYLYDEIDVMRDGITFKPDTSGGKTNLIYSYEVSKECIDLNMQYTNDYHLILYWNETSSHNSKVNGAVVSLTDSKGNKIQKKAAVSTYITSEKNFETTFENVKFLLGDIASDGEEIIYDGKITMSDAQCALNIALKTSEPSSLQLKLADYDKNGTVDLSDVQLIQKKALKIL